MSRTTLQRSIRAPLRSVFEVVAQIENYAKAIPHLVKVELLSTVNSGVGTRFRETRRLDGREASAELEVTEYVPNERIRIVADSHGTLWDSVFSVKPTEQGTELTLVMDATPRKLFARVMNPLLMSHVKRALEADVDALKSYCEAQASKRA